MTLNYNLSVRLALIRGIAMIFKVTVIRGGLPRGTRAERSLIKHDHAGQRGKM